jgi:VWFA-related protein
MRRSSSTSFFTGQRPGFWASKVRATLAAASLCALVGVAALAQKLEQASPDDDFRIAVETDLVVLHATVTDNNSRPVADLSKDHFRVFENNVEQQIKVFKREDIPVSVGIVVDNSGSMRDKRRGVNAAALKFVQSSNPMDEVFIVNFNEEAFLDADFTDSIALLEEGLERIDARGGTALYDAVDMSLEHLKDDATHDKRVLIAITDGEDNASRLSLEQIVQIVRQSNVMIYTVGLLGGENQRSNRRAKRALEEISKASGGAGYFPKDPDDVLNVASSIADDIRNQYVIAYTPTNLAKDGTFRKVEIKVNAPRRGKLNVRSRTGYYALANGPSSTPAPAGSSQNQPAPSSASAR